jgi:hypothetical protein
VVVDPSISNKEDPLRDLIFAAGVVREVPDAQPEDRTVQFVISDATRDRCRSVLNPRGWSLENFNRNPVVGYQHTLWGDGRRPPSPDDVLGVGRAWLEGEVLVGSVTFDPADVNPLAEKVLRKLRLGSLRAASVGFIPLGEGHFGLGEEGRGGPRETYYYAGQELVEFSIVNLPANPLALKRGPAARDARLRAAVRALARELGGSAALGDAAP